MNRRDLLNSAVAGTAASLLMQSGRAADVSFEITDTNVSLGQWPFRRLPLDETDKLVKKMRLLGIKHAWAGSFEAILHRDLRAVNFRLVTACSRHSELVPVGAINPTLPGWEGDLLHCANEYKMHAIRLHPNYHGYALGDTAVSRLIKMAADAGLIVQIPVAMEDIRTQHHLMQVDDVDLSGLPAILEKVPEAKIQILNHRRPLSLMGELAAFPQVSFDTARVDGTDGLAKLLRSFPPGRVAFGTHSPFLIPEAALIRAGESDLNDDELAALFQKNAEKLMSGLSKP